MSAFRAHALFRGTERFEILGALGRGASGTVYEVFDHVRKMRVALKTLHELDPEQRHRFKREFRALSNVHDEHLAELYELVADSEPWFFTMELIVGTDFMSHVRGSHSLRPGPATTTVRGRTSSAPHRDRQSLPCLGAPDLSRVRRAFAELSKGVFALHRRGLLHRDVKPSNVLVSTHGRVVLVDFGIVAELHGSQSSLDLTAIVGTPAYMAPEQGSGEGVSPATDWYAVGVMLFEALTGRLPFEGAGFDCIDEKLRRPAQRTRELVPSVPDELDDLCAALLAQDPADRPDFSEILRTLDAEGVRASMPALDADNDLFLGRERELHALEDALSCVRPEGPVVVHLSGTSGMGKSTVLQRFVHDLTVNGRALVLAGRCCERESVAFKALDDVIDALALHLATQDDDTLPALEPGSGQALMRLFPALAQVPGLHAAARTAHDGALESGSLLSLRARAVAALRTLLRHVASSGPVVLAIDDAQWGDQDSAHLLMELMAPPEPPGVLCVLAYRKEHESRAPLLEVKPSGSGSLTLQLVDVAALPDERARSLAAHWLRRAPDDPAVASIVAEAQGSPFLLSEFARHVRAVGVPTGGLNLAAVLRARFAELDDAPRKMLEALAVAARPLDAFLAARAALLDPEQGAAALRALRGAHLVRDSEVRAGATRIETFHDRLREALVSSMPGEQLSAQHGRFVEALLESESRDVEALFEHSRGAGDRARAADYAALAAQEAVRGLAFMRAAELFESAEQLAQPDDTRAHGWRVARADALACAGRRKDAGDAYVTASRSADAESEAKLKLECAAVQQYLTGGHFDVGMRIAEHTARSFGLPLASTRNQALLWMAARLGWLKLRGTRFVERAEHQVPHALLTQIDAAYRVGRGVAITDPIRGSELFLRTVSLALEAGEIKRVAVMLSCLSTLLAVEGPTDYVRSLVEQSTELALRTGDIETLAVASLGHGCMHALNGIWRPALVELERTDALFQQLRRLPTAEQKDTRSLLLVVRYYLGQMRALCQQVPAALAEAEQLGDAYSRSLLSTSKASLCWLALDQPEHHAELARTGVTTKPRGNALCIEHVLSVITLMDNDLYVGEPERALARLRAAYPAARASLLLRMVITSTLLEDVAGRTALMLALRGRDARDHRRVALAQARALQRRKHLPFPAASALMLRAGEADVALRADDAVTLYRQAAQAFDASDMALHAAVARLRLGQWLGGDEGRALCEQSLRWMREENILDPERMARMMAPSSRP